MWHAESYNLQKFYSLNTREEGIHENFTPQKFPSTSIQYLLGRFTTMLFIDKVHLLNNRACVKCELALMLASDSMGRDTVYWEIFAEF